MTTSKKVLLANSALFAFIDRNHPKHTESSAYFRYFAQEQFQLFVTLSTVNRTYNDLRKHMSYAIAKEFLRSMFVGNIEILYPDENLTRAALKLILSENQQDSNFDQALLNVSADRHQIPQICSFDFSKFYFGVTIFNLPY